ncbi:hypothetical protein A7P96_01195 [Eikenella sp. NML03-A-027]|uniref:hypothetical protein n=1 Tax=unclassified Eikenella TaxID=2639367 RepID=UPI0007DE87D6|nr:MULTISPECIES: hypothetical protein [unclassified Eikenella]OAM27768.1 hypothetical protein A7P94_05060 [Eikenella sp. NML01-A-086]OAM32814.1 hypothetical protein A7P96_01195 [Eikenella sp. NML03-A-027]OAM33673.1 hypothetical protein A7P97_07010 [Eikenella sp. NML070372]
MKITYNPPRPSVNYEIKLQAACELLKNSPKLRPDTDDEAAFNRAADDLAMCGDEYWDGYELAKHLEYHAGWDITSDIVEELEDYHIYIDRFLLREEKKWAEEHQIQPPFPIGSRVRVPYGFERVTATITALYAYEPARYLVKRDEQPEDDTFRSIIKFEDAELLEEGQS